jgi:hypothetical protein
MFHVLSRSLTVSSAGPNQFRFNGFACASQPRRHPNRCTGDIHDTNQCQTRLIFKQGNRASETLNECSEEIMAPTRFLEFTPV